MSELIYSPVENALFLEENDVSHDLGDAYRQLLKIIRKLQSQRVRYDEKNNIQYTKPLSESPEFRDKVVTSEEQAKRIAWWKQTDMATLILDFFRKKNLPFCLAIPVGSTAYGACLPDSDFDILIVYDDRGKEIAHPDLIQYMKAVDEGVWAKELADFASQKIGEVPFKIDLRFTTLSKISS